MPTPKPLDIAQIDTAIDQFEAVDFGDEDITVLQLAMTNQLMQLGRYAIIGKRYIEAGLVVMGEAALTGDQQDEGVTILLQLSRREVDPVRTWTNVSATVADGTAVDQISLFTRANGELEVRPGSFTWARMPYSRIFARICNGSFDPLDQPPWLISEPRREELRQQIIRILVACSINPERTAPYIIRSLNGTRKPRYKSAVPS